MEIFTKSAQETQKLGEKIGVLLINNGSCLAFSPYASHPLHFIHNKVGKIKNGAKILTLYGELGSGKTTLVQGLAKGLGIPHRIVSPTFIIVRRYKLNLKNYHWFYHIDLYRISSGVEIADLGLTEIFNQLGNIVTIEWAEKLGSFTSPKRIDIKFIQINEAERKIAIQGS